MARNMYTIHSVTKIVCVLGCSERCTGLHKNSQFGERLLVKPESVYASYNAMLIQRTNFLDVMYVSESECAMCMYTVCAMCMYTVCAMCMYNVCAMCMYNVCAMCIYTVCAMCMYTVCVM